MRLIVLTAILFLTGSFSIAQTQTHETNNPATLKAQFTSRQIIIDGQADIAWQQAQAKRIDIAMNSNLSATAPACSTFGFARALWDGAALYLLIDVTDPDVTAANDKHGDKDGVEIYLDLYNDKFPKYEEDDGMIRVSSSGELSGSGVYDDRLRAYAATPRFDNANVQCGYSVELAIRTGGIPRKNGSTIGMEFAILDANGRTNVNQYKIFWSDGNNKGINDNSRWGTVILDGYDGKSPMTVDNFLLRNNIRKAESMVRGIWQNETDLDLALAAAKQFIDDPSQERIDERNNALEDALKALRRKGKYPDPYDLKPVNHLPDPFAFLDGKKVNSKGDWSLRKQEIIDLAQYYEYGYMPPPPAAVKATVSGKTMTVTVEEKDKSASFDVVLTLPSVEQSGKNGPYPVIVSIDFRPGDAREIFLRAGYAVLSVIYTTIASDNYEHKGAFYSLYPYDVSTGHDGGTLLAWAWGASRGLDALTYLAKNIPEYSKTFDLQKVVVTGFSRCGKAALLAGLMDDRFGVVNPGASGCGGAAVYRYDSFGNTPARDAPFGNVYPSGTSPGCEVLPDKIRHQGHNSNEMLPRFLNTGRLYKTTTFGYGERLPYDHHQIIAAIAPRAVLITTANDDYANGAEGDCISMEAAKPVFRFLNAHQNLALNIRTTGEPNPRGWGGGHWIDDNQVRNLVAFSDMVFYGKPVSKELQEKFYSNPYLQTIETYYGGIPKVMPWTSDGPASKSADK